MLTRALRMQVVFWIWLDAHQRLLAASLQEIAFATPILARQLTLVCLSPKRVRCYPAPNILAELRILVSCRFSERFCLADENLRLFLFLSCMPTQSLLKWL